MYTEYNTAGIYDQRTILIQDDLWIITTTTTENNTTRLLHFLYNYLAYPNNDLFSY